jgi:hypothetical protein
MRRVFAQILLLAAALSAGGCGQVGLGPPRAASEPTPLAAPPASVPDFRAHAGQTYAAFVSEPGMERYSLEALGLSHDEQARFTYAMANQAVGVLATGGGSEALVFSGCAPSGCLEGLSGLAIVVGSGDVFVGVSDMTGAAELAPNDRLEALLRLTSPSRTWDDPVRPTSVPG